MRRLVLPAAVGAALGALATTVGPTADAAITDLGIYQEKAVALAAGRWPYSGFELEYPPLSLAPIALAHAVGPFDLAFGLLMLLCGAALIVATGVLGGSTAAWALALVGPFAVGASLRTHYDLLPTLLAVAGLAALVRGHPRTGMVVLAAGGLAKFWPALFLPFAAVWLWRRGEGRVALQGLGLALAVAAAASLPFLGDGYARLATFHLERPVQIESTPASVLLAVGGSAVTGVPANPDAFKSQGLEGGAAGAVALAFVLLEVAVIGWLLTRLGRRRAGPDELVLGCFAALLAFVALGKVLSPQFAIWLTPFAAWAWARRRRALALLTVAGVVLTQVEFPRLYWDLVGGDPYAAGVVGARNVALLAALGLALAAIASGSRTARSVAVSSAMAPAGRPAPRR